MDLTEVLFLVRQPLHLEYAHLEAVLHPPPVLCGWTECPPQADNDDTVMIVIMTRPGVRIRSSPGTGWPMGF